jgi:hypothetical protein
LYETVVDTQGNALDGEWVNPLSIQTTSQAGASVFPSGDGSPGGEFQFVVTLLGGDAIRDAWVNSADYSRLSSNFNQSGKTFEQGDFTGEGEVDELDFSLLSSNYPDNFQTIWVAADFDSDPSGPVFDVDEDDLAVLGDVNRDGVIDGTDLTLWQRQVGIALRVAV